MQLKREFYVRTIPIIITAILGIIMILEYIFTPPILADVASTGRDWAIIIFSMAIPLGALYLVRWHVGYIRKQTPGQWYFSIWMIVIMLVTLITGLVLTTESQVYINLIDYLMYPIVTTVWALLGFYYVSAAFRAFRARNLGTLVLLVTAFVMFLTYAPLAEIYLGSGVTSLNEWILAVPSSAANRGIIIGIAIGGLVLGLRTLLGLETGYLGRVKEEKKGEDS